MFLRIEVESPVGARGECLLKAAAGGETEDGGGLVGEYGDVAGWVELGGNAATGEGLIPGHLPRTGGVGPFVAAYPRLA